MDQYTSYRVYMVRDHTGRFRMVDAVSYSDARRYVGHRAAIYAAYLTSEEHWGAMFDEAARRRLFYRCVSNSKKAMAADFSADQDA